MGTSTCDMLVAPAHAVEGILVKGICGQVHGSVIPGMIGLEAGQSAFGDVYAWFKNLLSWPLAQLKDKELSNTNMINNLSSEASRLPVGEGDELAVDWLNGRRTPDADQLLKAAVTNLDLATDAPRFFKSLVEATCFGARAITDRFVEEGITVKGLIGLGGVARKSPYIMQTMADIMDMPIRIHRSEQTCAAGAAMFAATAAGLYEKVEHAMKQMGQGFDKTYYPNPSRKDVYAKRYAAYRQLGHLVEQNKRF
jgi:L-ribulokinase